MEFLPEVMMGRCGCGELWKTVLVRVLASRDDEGAVAVVTPWNIVLARVLAGAVAVLNPWVLVLVGVLAGRDAGVLWLW